jgi:hypothetical protein
VSTRSTDTTTLSKHDAAQQCELLTPALIASHGGSVQACAKSLNPESGLYSHSMEDYVAGGRIELNGNQAVYEAPPDSRMAGENEASDGSDSATVFTATYTEGAWRLTENSE